MMHRDAPAARHRAAEGHGPGGHCRYVGTRRGRQIDAPVPGVSPNRSERADDRAVHGESARGAGGRQQPGEKGEGEQAGHDLVPRPERNLPAGTDTWQGVASAAQSPHPEGTGTRLLPLQMIETDPSKTLTTGQAAGSGTTVKVPAGTRSRAEVPTKTSTSPGSTTYCISRS